MRTSFNLLGIKYYNSFIFKRIEKFHFIIDSLHIIRLINFPKNYYYYSNFIDYLFINSYTYSFRAASIDFMSTALNNSGFNLSFLKFILLIN